MTRRWKENQDFIQRIKLVMIDEVHLLSDPNRGNTETTIFHEERSLEVLILQTDNFQVQLWKL